MTRARTGPFPGSRPAELRYIVRQQADDRALLHVELVTGRRHQIRAQLALCGLPVWNDVKYGARRRPGLAGIGLHAWRLAFAHPVGGTALEFAAPCPADWPWRGEKE